MCFSAEWSMVFALISVIAAYIMHGKFKSTRHTCAILFFGAMEFLQVVQYFWIATEDDGWSMCKNPTNQFLTLLGFLHICLQPFFLNIALDALWRRVSYTGRIHNDLVQRLCLVGGLWLFSRYVKVLLWPETAEISNEACPNMDWLSAGYDGGIKQKTPNDYGYSCTYRSPTKSAHISWAIPLSETSYFSPNSALHAFLMFAPALVHPDKIARIGGVFLFVTGPLMAAWITPSLNEQASVWCFFSMFQVVFLITASYFLMDKEVVFPPTIEHPGDGFSNEEPVHYTLTKTAKGTN
jgi:hypothetical protein